MLTVIQAGIGVAAVLSFNALASSQGLLQSTAGVYPILAAIGIDAYLAPIVISSAAAMLPATLLLGLAFPMGLSLWAGDDTSEDTSRRVGAFYSLNVLGAIAGSVAAGFVLLPALGSRGSLVAASALAMLSSVMLAVTAVEDAAQLRGIHGAGRTGGLRDGRAQHRQPVRRGVRALPSAANGCCGVRRACRPPSRSTSDRASARRCA